MTLGQWPPLSGFVSLHVKWQTGGLACATVPCCDAFSPPMGRALTSLPPSRTLPSICQVAGIETWSKCPWVPHESRMKLAAQGACPELWGTVTKHKEAGTWADLGRKHSSSQKGSFQSSPVWRPRPQPVPPCPCPPQGGRKGRSGGWGVTSHLTAPILSILF